MRAQKRNLKNLLIQNRGHVMYHEMFLFHSDEENSEASKQEVAEIIAHELSHFWFGNLVTCKWWDELWLNEAMVKFNKIEI